MGGYTKKKNVTVQQLIDKLAQYEDLAEKGLLVELPCKVGDTVYFIKSMFLYSKSPMRGTVCMLKTFSKNCEFSFHVLMDVNNRERVFTNSDIGKTVFLTQSEAEQALADMEK
jgi:hypothetical protein